MKPKTVSVSRTFNLGKFQSAKIEWEVQVEEGESLGEITETLLALLETLGKEKGWLEVKT